ncbi:3'-5' exonuclease [Elizabethkingia anophelis]|uniref:3'-5' exonuclease n=1 Tax=Elizabethkingia anophelis TaxID=1117645 RepID=UPI0023E99C6C|nr:3'-5' exonuclease [Elizabethkingia anophelis]GJN62409.1 DNA polymerase III subunit epsilon [Elizabethkingia anophelis]HDP3253654.1 3'-5' exonuclease [Elizabethkingia anophelis]
MNLKLHKPLCIFDLETTGINISKDRIVEICILKVFPDASRETKTWLVNPEMPIPKESSDIHGITDEMVADKPTLKEIAPKIIDMIKDSDLGGFNSNRFDIPLLAEELLRVDFDFDLSKHKPIDVQTIFHKMEPRNLSAAYQFYCGKSLENAHSAEADTLATFEILDAQVGKYDELGDNAHSLSEFSFHKRSADLAGFIIYNDKEEEMFSFGKYKGQKVLDVFDKDPGYFGWIQNADFPLYTKKILTAIKLKSKF